MKKILKRTAITLAGLIVVLGASGFGLFVRGKVITNGAPEIAVSAGEISTDAALIARGAHIVTAIAPCAGCHGAGLKGEEFGTPPMLVKMAAPNLTSGKGGFGANATYQDWNRAVRYGIGKDGRSLVIMPSHSYAHMSDDDFNALVAYLNTVAPQDNVLPARKVGPMGAILTAAGAFPLASRIIAKETPSHAAVPAGVTAEYGKYLVTLGTCADCHGPDLAGQNAHGTNAPSLLTNPPTWTLEQFRVAMRTGKTPEGKALDGEKMPWPYYANMTDDELAAVWTYLKSL